VTRKALILLLLDAASCSAVSKTVGSVTGSTQKEEVKSELAGVQIKVMRFADTYVGTMSQATELIDATSPEARLTLVDWRLRQATGAYDIASGPNPIVNAIDMAILITLTRLVLERYWVPQVFGESGRPLLEVLRRLEPRAWMLIPADLDQDKIGKARELVGPWLDRHPNLHDVASVRTVDLSSETGTATSGGLGSPGDVLGAVGLNPLGGLDPAVQQVEQSRVLAERALYYAKRWPMLLDLQTQKMALELSLQPASRQLLVDADRMSRAAQSMGEVAGALPEVVDRQREAAIAQVLGALRTEGGKSRALLINLKEALDAGREAANSVERATASVQALRASATRPVPGAPPPKPFDIGDYTRALEQMERTTADLQTLVDSLERNAPQVQALVRQAAEQASDKGEALADYVFRRAIALVGLLLGGILAVSLAYRWVSSRLAVRGASPPSVEARSRSG
jgi:hypothetical protein